MKKLIAFSLVLVFLLSLTACSANGTDNSKPQIDNNTTNSPPNTNNERDVKLNNNNYESYITIEVNDGMDLMKSALDDDFPIWITGWSPSITVKGIGENCTYKEVKVICKATITLHTLNTSTLDVGYPQSYSETFEIICDVNGDGSIKKILEIETIGRIGKDESDEQRKNGYRCMNCLSSYEVEMREALGLEVIHYASYAPVIEWEIVSVSGFVFL